MSKVTDLKFIGLIAPRLLLFKKKGRCWSFRCPFCGDSKKNRTKTRGYLFEAKGAVMFKCHNCTLAFGLGTFLQKVDAQLAKAYFFETFAERNPRPGQAPILAEPVKPEPPGVGWQTFALPHMGQLNPNHAAVEYLRKRKVPVECWRRLFFVHDMATLEKLFPEKYADTLPNDDRIVLPYYDKTGKLLGLTARAIGPAQKRYIQMRFVEDVPLVFGLPEFEPTESTYVTEGAFDSLFLPNALAAGGSDFEKVLSNYVLADRTVVVFDNQPRNAQLIKKMEQIAKRNWRIVVWPSNWPYKDINEAVMAGLTPGGIKQIIDSNAHDGMAFQMALKAWRRC